MPTKLFLTKKTKAAFYLPEGKQQLTSRSLIFHHWRHHLKSY